MLCVLIAWAGPLGGVIYSALEGIGFWAFFTSPDAVDVAFLGILAIVAGSFLTGGDLPEMLLTPMDGLANLLVFLGAVMNLLCLFILPHIVSIQDWFRQNGILGLFPYLAILAAILLANRKKVQAEKTLSKKTPLPLLPLPAGLYLITPSLILYLYGGLADLDTVDLGVLEPNLDILHWNWSIKISAVIFLADLVCFILRSYPQKRPLFWQGMAQLGNLALLAFGYLLLERVLYPVSQEGLLTRVFLYLPMLAIAGFFHLASYLYFLVGLLDLIFPGAVREWRLNKEAREAAEAAAFDPEREKLERQLDSEERLLNALAGNGPITEEEALMAGRTDTRDYLTSRIYREQKRDKPGKK